MTELVAAPEPVYEPRRTVTFREAMSGRYPFVPISESRAKFWLVCEGEGADYWVTMLSDFPYPFMELPEGANRIPMHNIDIELEQLGWDDILDLNVGRSPRENEYITFMLNEGLCPNQPFQVDMSLWWEGHTSMEWMGVEWDMEVEWDIIGREYVEPMEAANRWAEYLETFRETQGFSGNDVG